MLEILELVWIPLGILIGWIHLRQNKLEAKLESKADTDDIREMSACMSEIKTILTEVRLEVAKWIGKLEGQVTPRG